MTTSKAEQAEKKLKRTDLLGKLKVYLSTLGPGLITGASDDDPSGIGTYAQTGAMFGYTQLWTALITFPLMAAVQEICARIALQTGTGLATNIRRHYPRPILYFCVLLLVVANTVNIGADLGAMAASAQLLIGIPFIAWLLIITLLSIVLQIFVDYRQYSKILRVLAFSLVAYFVAALLVKQDWGLIVRDTLIPTLQLDRDFILNIVAILGTTISPYLFFWQAGAEVEEMVEEGEKTEAARKGTTHAEVKWMRTDVISGMLFSNVTMWFIIITTASTLYAGGIHEITSAPQAAEALRPVAGDFAYLLFALGIVGTGLLAVPILAGSAAYAVAETFKMREGLYLKLQQAPGFYGVIAVATVVGAGINFLGINPIQALYYTAVINGLVAPPLLIMIMLIAGSKKIMGQRANGPVSSTLGWLATAAMTLAAAALIFSGFFA